MDRADVPPDAGSRQEGIWIIDGNAKTVYANERMAEILGTSTAEMIGKPSFTYVFPEDVEDAQRLFASKSRGDAMPFRFRLRRDDGSTVWVDVQGTPLQGPEGEFTGVVGTFTEIAVGRNGAIY